MSSLQLLWFVLIGVLFSGFFFLEGFDFGVGMASRLIARDKEERDQVISTIGPVWDGNEVWLLTAGGAMFASFPEWYATLFSGYYIFLFLILFGLIIRGVSFEFRAHMHTAKGRNIWEWTLFIGSIMAPFFFGMMFTSMVSGMPIDAENNIMHATFGNFVSLFSIVGGVAVTLLCLLHGLNFIRLKTLGDVRERAKKLAEKLYIVLFVGLVAFAILLYTSTDFFEKKFALTLALLVVIVLLTVLATYGTYKDKEMLAFLTSGLTLVGVVVLLFCGLFPRVMVDSNGVHDMLIQNASSTPYTLKTMTIVAFTILPFVLAYQAWSYFVFRKRIKKENVVK